MEFFKTELYYNYKCRAR